MNPSAAPAAVEDVEVQDRAFSWARMKKNPMMLSTVTRIRRGQKSETWKVLAATFLMLVCTAGVLVGVYLMVPIRITSNGNGNGNGAQPRLVDKDKNLVSVGIAKGALGVSAALAIVAQAEADVVALVDDLTVTYPAPNGATRASLVDGADLFNATGVVLHTRMGDDLFLSTAGAVSIFYSSSVRAHEGLPF